MWNENGNSSSSGLSGKMVFFIIVLVVVLNLFIIAACRVYIKKKMQARMESDTLDDRISSAVTTYMALKDKN